MLVRIKDDYGEANMIPANLLAQLREAHLVEAIRGP
jgi:DNA-binding IscR family transcriptional regulator